jgi:hypothetical protein
LFRIQPYRRNRTHHINQGISAFANWAETSATWHIALNTARDSYAVTVSFLIAATGKGDRSQTKKSLLHEAAGILPRLALVEFH